jgi:Tfp pilus assembly protein PilX
MKTLKTNTKNRENERGAALIMALLISFLLLVASAGLLLESSMNSANVTDAVAEQQAYHAAEGGIQSAVHILRCQKNDAPTCADVRANPLLDTSASATSTKNQINYSRAIDPGTSSATGSRRDLSLWVDRTKAHYTTCGTTATPCYELNTPGYSYALDITDPDNTSKNVSFTMSGGLVEHDTGNSLTKTYGSGGNTLTITYIPPSAISHRDLSGGPMNDLNYGTIRITKQGTGAQITSDNRLFIDMEMTEPYDAPKTIRGWILHTASASAIPKIIFDSQTLTLAGSAMSLNLAAAPSTGWSGPEVIDTLSGTEPYLGYRAQPSAGDNVIGGSMTAPEPVRLLIKSTGYGPRGAKKELQAIIQKNFFMGLTAPAALTMVGPHRTGCDGGKTSSPSTGPGSLCTDEKSHFYFDIGDSNVVNYSGADIASKDIIPPVGTSNPQSLSCVEDFLARSSSDTQCTDTIPNGSLHFHGNVEGSPSDVSAELPPYLRTPEKLDTQIHQLASTAKSSGRYFASGTTPTDWGNAATGQGITFCDGDVELGHDQGNGGGILVVTGTLTLKGSFSFTGLIIVTGKGGITRSGGGSGEVTGNVVVAPYQNSKIVDRVVGVNQFDDPPGIFLAPHYDISGGGTSNLQFNSLALQNGLTAISNFVIGVMEK